MEKRIFISLFAIICFLGSAVVGAAQDTKANEDGMEDVAMMKEMHKSSHHIVTMALRQNIVNLARSLSEMAKDEMNFDKDVARIAILEIEHGIEKIDEIHKRHLATLGKDMRKKIEDRMEKNIEKVSALNENYCELEMLLQAESMDLEAFATRANAIAAYFEKSDG